MNLLDLRIACYLYNQFTNYDKSYLDLVNDYKNLDLNETEHVRRLLEWLRSWGCRQFKKNEEGISINNIKEWYKSNESNIPVNEDLLNYNLTENGKRIADTFDDLSERIASLRKGETKVRIGIVGTAKILFALRPKLFAAWDKAIIEKLEKTGDGNGYVDYLSGIQKELIEIKNEFEKSGGKWIELFTYLKKKHKSYPKLIDEYYWITNTKGIEPMNLYYMLNEEL